MAGNTEGKVFLFDTENHEKLDEATLSTGGALSFTKYSTDGAAIAVATVTGSLFVLNAEHLTGNGKSLPVPLMDLSKSEKSGGRVTSLIFGPDNFLAVADSLLRLFIFHKKLTVIKRISQVRFMPYSKEKSLSHIYK